jgi:DivIVA domain-containing protein
LSPEQVASRAFPISFRGFDQSEVRSFLAAVAEELRAAVQAGERAAAGVIAAAEERAADLLGEAQDEARRIRATVESERERAFADGAARAEELVGDAERVRSAAETVGAAEAERLVAEARAVRERILGDLARRRATLREQVEQLHAARERLLGALAGLRSQVDEAAEQMRGALPEAKVAADAAARRVAAEPLPTTVELEQEIEAFRAAGLELTPTPTPVPDEEAPEAETAAEPAAAAPGDASQNGTHQPAAEEAAPEESGGTTERRSTTVRVFRTRRDPTPALGLAEPELHAVEPAAPFEEVRLVAASDAEAEAEAAHVAQEGEEEGEAAPLGAAAEAGVDVETDEPLDDPDAEAPALSPPEALVAPLEADIAPTDLDVVHAPPPSEAIDELFARLKAGRRERTAAAEVVLAPATGAPRAPDTAATEPEPTDATGVAAEATGDSAAELADATVLARRDAAIVPFLEALAKRLKRQLADEQNAVLDGLRRGESRIFDLADPDDHAAAWSLAAAHDLAAAANAGARFDGGDTAGPISGAEVATVAEQLADLFARPLRAKVLEALDAAEGDQSAAAAAVRSIYRERRGRRLEEAAEHAVLGAFSTGIQTAAPVGVEFRWVVDDGPTSCPDCDDNALAGAVSAGSPFPTGHVRPPAHPGCRCLLVRHRAR